VMLITNEAHSLLAEIATYEEPRIFLDDSPTLATLTKSVGRQSKEPGNQSKVQQVKNIVANDRKGHVTDIKDINGRRDTILSIIKDKGTVYIKDISTIFRDIGEKTIQRELQKLVRDGVIAKSGNRRWTQYTLI